VYTGYGIRWCRLDATVDSSIMFVLGYVVAICLSKRQTSHTTAKESHVANSTSASLTSSTPGFFTIITFRGGSLQRRESNLLSRRSGTHSNGLLQIPNQQILAVILIYDGRIRSGRS